MNFEESLERLEEITEKLESQDISLEDSLKMFEEGVRLSKFCEKKLTESEQKLEIIKSEEIEEFSEKNIAEESQKEIEKPLKIENENRKKKLKNDNNHEENVNKDNFLF